jgi:hypothetical protein
LQRRSAETGFRLTSAREKISVPEKDRDRENAFANTPEACATQSAAQRRNCLRCTSMGRRFFTALAPKYYENIMK